MFMIKLTYNTSGWSNGKISKVSEDFESLIGRVSIKRSNRTLEVYMETTEEDLTGYLISTVVLLRDEIRRQVRGSNGYPEEIKASKVGSSSSLRATI